MPKITESIEKLEALKKGVSNNRDLIDVLIEVYKTLESLQTAIDELKGTN